MGNRTSHLNTVRGRHLNRSLSKIDTTSWPVIVQPRRSGSVQSYLQSPTATLKQYLQQHSQKYAASGGPEVKRPFYYENPYTHPRERISSQSRSACRSTHKTIMNKQPAGLGRKEGRWFHEMKPRDETNLRDRDTSIESPTSVDNAEETADTEAAISRFSSENENSKLEYSTKRPSSCLKTFTQITERPLSATSEDQYDSSCVSCREPNRKSHSCYSFVDPRSEDTSRIPSRTASVHQSGKNPIQQASERGHSRLAKGDWNSNVSSTPNALNKSESLRRCSSACSSRNTKSVASTVPPRQMGFHTQPDGMMTYTAFLRSGPCGNPVNGWVNDLRRRASRHLTGLYRQYQCTVSIESNLIPYRGSYVYALLITGAKQSDLIRCRNALPECIEKYLITPYAQHSLIMPTH